MSPKSYLVHLGQAALRSIYCLSIALYGTTALGATVFIDGDDGSGNAPAVFNSIDVGSFNDGDGATAALRQGWNPVRMANLEVDGGALTNRNGGGLGTNENMEGDNYIRLDTDNANALPDVPDSFVVGELPGQYDVIQFDLRYDAFPPEDPNNPGSGLIEPRLRARTFLQGGSTHGVNFITNSQLQSLKDANDTSFHTYTIVRDFNDGSVWNSVEDILRIDAIDGIGRTDPVGTSAILGSKFTIDNIVLARTTPTQAFPAIEPVQPNIVRNGDLSDTSNVVLSGDNDGAFDINGSNGNFGPFRGSGGDVDHWAPYNNNPNGIVEAVADGGALDLFQDGDSTKQAGSFYLDTHYSVSTERFTLNSAGGYLNGLTQADVLNGVTIDETATYEFAFDAFLNETRFSNPDSTLTFALTIGDGETDANSAGAITLFESTLDLVSDSSRPTASVSGAALKAAQDSGEPVNLILQSLADTPIPNFPGGTPVPNDHRDVDSFTQVSIDNISLIKLFASPTGDVNKDGVVSQADVALAQDYLDGNGGETAEKRQNDLFNAPSAPLEADILASLNLTDFDLDGSLFFDQTDVDMIAALVTVNPLFGDADNDDAVSGSDLLAVTNNFGSTGAADGLLLGDADDDGAVSGSDLLAVTNNFGATQGSGSLEGQPVPEPATVGLVLLACAIVGVRYRTA